MNVFAFQQTVSGHIQKGHIITALLASALLHLSFASQSSSPSLGENIAPSANTPYSISISLRADEAEPTAKAVKAVAQEKVEVQKPKEQVPHPSVLPIKEEKIEPKVLKPVEQSVQATPKKPKEQAIESTSKIVSNAVSQASSGKVQDYRKKIIAWLEAHKKYPRRATKRGIEGEVTLTVSISHSGQLMSSAIVKSSGFDLLDKEVLNMLQRATPFPKAPENYTSAVNMTIPIEFYLP
jgi:protein TonB